MRTRTVVIAIVVGAVLGIALSVFVAGSFLDSLFQPPQHTHNREFDRQVWLAHRGDQGGNVRGSMSLDLVTRTLKNGLPEQSVRFLLGRPDILTRREWTYYVGPAPHFGGGEVDIYFDRARRIDRVRRVAFGGF